MIIKSLGITVRAFSATLDVPESSTRNYLDKGTKLNSDYLERIAHHFRSINLNWLITGQGEPFLSTDPQNLSTNLDAKKISRSNVQVTGANKGSMSISTADLEKDLATANEKIALLTSQLADKERIIQLLEKKQ